MRVFKNNPLKITIIAIFSILLPKLITTIETGFNDEFPQYVTYIIVVSVILLICLFIEFVKILQGLTKKRKATFSVEKIEEIASKYEYNEKDSKITNMFNISESDEELAETVSSKNHHPIIFYYVIAKENISWIDYVYFEFLNELSSKLKAKIIIGLDAVGEEKKDEAINLYEKYLKLVIPKVKIIKKQNFYKKDTKSFAVDFHSFFIATMLKYIEEIDPDKTDSIEIKKYINYIDMIFPVEQIAKKYAKKRQVFILDRSYVQEIWKNEKLVAFKNKYQILFIGSNTLKDEHNEKIDIFNPNRVINLNEDEKIIEEKIKNLSNYEVNLIFRLLRNKDLSYQEPSDIYKALTEKTKRVRQELLENYEKKYEEKLPCLSNQN